MTSFMKQCPHDGLMCTGDKDDHDCDLSPRGYGGKQSVRFCAKRIAAKKRHPKRYPDRLTDRAVEGT